jgi:hypothetical protein
MSRAARSVRWFGIYLAVLGVTLVFVPNLLLTAFGLPETREVYIRVLGVVVFDLGVYYWFAAASEAVPFFRATVAGRALVLVAFTAFVALGLVSPLLILFGAGDLAGGLWTAWALRADRRAPVAALAS